MAAAQANTWRICFSFANLQNQKMTQGVRVRCLNSFFLLLQADTPEGYNTENVEKTDWFFTAFDLKIPQDIAQDLKMFEIKIW